MGLSTLFGCDPRIFRREIRFLLLNNWLLIDKRACIFVNALAPSPATGIRGVAILIRIFTVRFKLIQLICNVIFALLQGIASPLLCCAPSFAAWNAVFDEQNKRNALRMIYYFFFHRYA
jgi:hypothetical protein